MKLIFCLGNPGREYEGTRHNTGFMTADRISERYDIKINEEKLNGRCGKGVIAGEKLLVIKPLTFMNNSGQCVRAFMDYFKVGPDDVIVIYDDIDLDPGRIRVRANGSAGSHNGMKSVIAHLGTTAFSRIRVGVGACPTEWDLVDYVLARPAESDREAIKEGIEAAADAVECIIRDGISEAMNRFNRKTSEQTDQRAL